MTASRATPAGCVRAIWLTLATVLLVSCAGEPPKPTPSSPTASANAPAHSTRKPWKSLGPYTPGGLYAPGVSDGAPDVPPDIASLPEPVPHAEPLSHYGNRSPYAVLGKTYAVLPSAAGYVERGMASWYGTKFDGRVTSSLEPYDLSQFTAAHKTLPLPSYARVTNLENGRSVIVRINDRGPFHEGRLIDLSYAAAIKLGVNVHGTAMVEVRGIDTRDMPASAADDVAASKSSAPRPVAVAPKPAAPKPYRPQPVSAATVALASGIPAAALATTLADVGTSAAASPTNDGQAKPGDESPEPQAAITRPAYIDTPAAAATPLPEPPPQPPTLSPPATVAPPPPVATTPHPAATVPVASTMPPAAATAASLVPAGTIPAVLANPLPADVAPPTRPGHPVLDPATPGFLQIASYGDRSNAKHMLQRLQQAGVEHAELVSVQVANQTLWRVHIGPMREDEAERIAAHLDALGFGTPPFFKE